MRAPARSRRSWNGDGEGTCCISQIQRLFAHTRLTISIIYLSGSLGERASLDAFRDLKVVLDALKSMERIGAYPQTVCQYIAYFHFHFHPAHSSESFETPKPTPTRKTWNDSG